MTDIEAEINRLSEEFGVDRKRSIGEAADEIGVETHVIRFWEEHFPQIKPELGKGGRRSYYNSQIKILKHIKKCLHEDGLTIAGLQKMLKKRKNNDSSEESVEIIIANDIARDVDIQNIDFSNKNILNRPIGDFIDSAIDFSGNKVHNIREELDESAKDEIHELIQNISGNLKELKTLLRN